MILVAKCKRARWWESRRLDELPEENDVDQWHAEETLEAEDDDYDDHWPADWQDDQDDQWHEEMLEADESLWPAQKDDRDSESTLLSHLSDWGMHECVQKGPWNQLSCLHELLNMKLPVS